jgi:HEAT repeat protein
LRPSGVWGGLAYGRLPFLFSTTCSPVDSRSPTIAVKNALVTCCHDSPKELMHYLKQATGPARQLLARVLAELATADLGEDLILLATDADPEVRASAARALGNAQPSFALPVLSVMVQDKEWFVRLRVVVALAFH